MHASYDGTQCDNIVHTVVHTILLLDCMHTGSMLRPSSRQLLYPFAIMLIASIDVCSEAAVVKPV